MAPVLKVAALVLSEVTKDVFPDSFGRLNLSTLWPSLHRYVDEVVLPWRESTEFEVVCDDLVGFFNSLPIDRITQAVEFVFLAYFQCRPAPNPDKFTFTVHDKQKFSEGRVLRGKPRRFRTSVMRQISAGDVKQIVDLSLKLSKFMVLRRCFKQCRGSPIGNQISPALCDLAVSVEEAMWTKSCKIMEDSRRALCWFGRYVDNRFLIFPREYLGDESFQALVSPRFYREPVVLESCDEGDLLGCSVDIVAGIIEFKLPQEASQYRPLNSAGSRRLNLGSFRSRKSLIMRQAFPKKVVRKQLRELEQRYLAMGFTKHDLGSCGGDKVCMLV